MHPAPSIILFTVLSGMGFGLLAVLACGALQVTGWGALAIWGLGYALAVAGLVASGFHLGNPQRALRAFTQWRSSWLSREAWASALTLVVLGPMALSDGLGLGLPRAIGWAGAAMCGVTVFCTSMIYAQLHTVPRWNHWTTPALFLAFAAAGGAILAVRMPLALALCAVLAAVLLAAFALGDRQFAARGQTIGTATGLGGLGAVRVFERGHTADNYLLREMIHVVGRRHAVKLRVIAVALSCALPALVLLALPAHAAAALAGLAHLAGAVTARWLFFAEAEHVVGLYYGQR